MESVQGLICFRGIARRSESDKTPRIWNPTMRKFITLPKPQTSHYWMKRTSLFLGFDPIEGKHKVVCMPRERFFDECLVLTLGSSSSWRRIKTNHYHRPQTGIYSKGQCINGVLYYKAFDRKENRVLVSFDVRTEKFQPITVPLGSIWGVPIAYKWKLAFVNYVINGERIKLCVLEDAEKHKWSHKSFRVPLSSYDPSLKTRFKLSGVTDGGEFIYIPSTILKSFCVLYFDPERENFREVVYDGIANDEFRLRNGLGDDPLKVLTAFPNHLESLISLGEGVGVYDKPNPWEFETTQFDDILKKLKVVINPRAHFYYDEEEEEEEEESDEKDTVIETSLPAKRKREEIIQEPKKIKLKNLCKQILKKNGGSMKLKQLRSLIDEQAQSVLSEFSSRKDAIAHLKHKLERSGKFVVEGKKISLVSRKK